MDRKQERAGQAPHHDHRELTTPMQSYYCLPVGSVSSVTGKDKGTSVAVRTMPGSVAVETTPGSVMVGTAPGSNPISTASSGLATPS